jgi:MoxR-like ATPase
MSYRKLFNVTATEQVLKRFLDAPGAVRHSGAVGHSGGDRRDGFVYDYHTDDIELRVNVALATARPLLLRGPSGSGKSSLARNVAIRLGRRYYEQVVTSSTQHTDLLWSFDALRRFHDAQQGKEGSRLKDEENYLEPGALWWAFDPASARRRGAPEPSAPKGSDPKRPAPEGSAPAAGDPSPTKGEKAVVLIDEIDKADPDLPNNLLVALGSLEFSVPYIRTNPVRAAAAPLVMITSNEERDLPAAFLRRCVTLNLTAPPLEKLTRIAALHYGASIKKERLYRAAAEVLFSSAGPEGQVPSTAEYLDTVAACVRLGVRPSKTDKTWLGIQAATVLKKGPGEPPGQAIP